MKTMGWALAALVRVTTVTLAAAMGIVSAAPAQLHPGTSLPCWPARPAPGCRAFVLTNFGIYVAGGDRHDYDGRYRVLGDWGGMINVTRHDAVGATFFFSVDWDLEHGGQFGGGPALRYRRWITSRSALEVAVGHRIRRAGRDSGAVFWMVKYSPSPLIGLALRGEVVSGVCPSAVCCACWGRGWVTSRRVLAGVEVGEAPGLWAGAVCAVVGGLVSELVRGAFAHMP